MKEMMRELASRFANQLTRGKHVLSAYDPTGSRTFVQMTGMAGETLQGVELLLPFGMSAIPAGQTANLLVFQVNGHRDHKVALMADDPALRIPGLQPGEFGFRDARGQQVVFHADHLEVTTPQKLVINTTGDTDLTVAQGNLNVTVSQGNASVTAPAGKIILAGGGPAVARVGDTVTCPAGTGHITSGSGIVQSG